MDPQISNLQDQVNTLTQQLNTLSNNYQFHSHTGSDQTQPIQINGNVNSTTLVTSPTPTVSIQGRSKSSVTRTIVTITAQSTSITSFTTNLSGQANNFDILIVRIKDNGTSQALAWGTSFIAKGSILPTSTPAGKLLTVGFLYDSVLTMWGCVATAYES